MAGGCGLATACDFVVAAEDARFLYSEVRIGFVAALVATYLPLRLRGSDIRELLLAPEFVPAARAREIGLVNRVVPPAELAAAGEALVDEIADPGLVGVDRAHQAAAPRDRRPAARRAARARGRGQRGRARDRRLPARHGRRSSPPRARPAGATESRRAVRLILFDIDGTLLDCGGQAKPIFAEALVEVFGETGDVDGYDFSGRTDPRIVLDLMTGAGRRAGRGSRARPGGARPLPRAARPPPPPRALRGLPGVVELLEELAGAPGRGARPAHRQLGAAARGSSSRRSGSTTTSPSAASVTTGSTATSCRRWPRARRAPPGATSARGDADRRRLAARRRLRPRPRHPLPRGRHRLDLGRASRRLRPRWVVRELWKARRPSGVRADGGEDVTRDAGPGRTPRGSRASDGARATARRWSALSRPTGSTSAAPTASGFCTT